MMASTLMRTPASWKMRAESSSPSPTSANACSWDHVPPKLSTSGVSAAIQYGSVSTRVPSMSHRTAARRGAFTVQAYPGAAGPILEGTRWAGGGGLVDGLGRRVLVAGFDGWNDAGEAASSAMTRLREG